MRSNIKSYWHSCYHSFSPSRALSLPLHFTPIRLQLPRAAFPLAGLMKISMRRNIQNTLSRVTSIRSAPTQCASSRTTVENLAWRFVIENAQKRSSNISFTFDSRMPPMLNGEILLVKSHKIIRFLNPLFRSEVPIVRIVRVHSKLCVVPRTINARIVSALQKATVPGWRDRLFRPPLKKRKN